VGLGYIIPWVRGPDEPEPVDDEIFSHWTDDETDFHETFQNASVNSQLLIGGAPKLRTNDQCSFSMGQITSTLRRQNRLRYYKTSKPIKYRDSQTINVGLSGYGIGVVYAEQYKVRKSASLKKSIIAAWRHDPEERSPSIVTHRSGVEISGCTGNARRRRLSRILCSTSVRNLLKRAVMEWKDPECEAAYFNSLEDRNVLAFTNLYHKRKDWREDIGRAVATSLGALLLTGTDENRALQALWCPNSRDSWLASFPYSEQHWAGLLSDTANSCSVAVVTEKCLGFKNPALAWASSCQHHCGSPRSQNSSTQSLHQNQFGILETAISINRDAILPRGLLLNEEQLKWGYKHLERKAVFDLGDSGRLKLVNLFHHSKGLFMRWQGAHFGKEYTEAYRKKIAKKPEKPVHRELILSGDYEEDPIQVHVTSHW
jgi:hypothetical protein